ncbi:MAG: hypothetical protein IKF90_09665 [Parasporobacterium sp.]|nr:hypothetical protein [Parasporobacterium sp.]
MENALFFIGHYDYFIYSMLLNFASAENKEADYIIQQVKNSRDVISFVQNKAKEKNPYGNLALVDDELFLGKESEAATLSAIQKEYDAILKKFGMRIKDYDHIYMSFDEWNSFGVYLSQFRSLPPVTVLLKSENQVQNDIYHFLDVPGLYHFSALQKKYRVLSGEASFISDFLIIGQNSCAGSVNGKPSRCFDVFEQMKKLSREEYEQLCQFFEYDSLCFDPKETDLLVPDSYWFESPERSVVNEYTRVYLTFLDLFYHENKKLLIKEHPRYAIPENQRKLFPDAVFLKGHIPFELIRHPEEQKFSRTLMIGCPVSCGTEWCSEQSLVLDIDFFFNWNSYSRLDFILRFCQEKGMKTAVTRNLSGIMASVYTQHMNPECRLKFAEYPGKRKGFGASSQAYIFKDVTPEIFQNEVLPLLGGKDPVFILNPEFMYQLTDQETYEKIADSMVVVSFNQYALDQRNAVLGGNPVLWCFSNQEAFRKEAASYKYHETKQALGIRIRTAVSSKSREAIVFLPKKTTSKDYILKKAKTHPVVIFGAGEIAYRFVSIYEKVLNIRAIMTDDFDDIDERILENYEVKHYNRAEIGKEDYIIVCLPFTHNIDILPPYAIVRDQLLREGFQACRDFTYYRIFEAAEKKKPIILFCGYCELGGMKQVLDMTRASEDFCMVFYHIGRETMTEAPGYADFVASAKLCDILVHAPLVVNRGVMDADVLSMISPETKTIFVPQISFRGYAPYKVKNFLQRNIGISLFGIIRYPFLYQIKNVNMMILKGRTNEQILQELKRPDLFSEEEIKNNLEEAFRILAIMDAKSDIPIFDYIKDNYQKELLFKDCIHTNDSVFFEYARRFSKYIGKDYIQEINDAEKICRETGAYFQVASEEPILPCVAKALNLTFATEDRLYMEKVTEEHIRMRTFDEWYNDYCDYFRSVITVNRTLNPDYKTQQVTIYRSEEKKYDIGGKNRNG